MVEANAENNAHYVLGLIEAFASQLSKEINVPVENCRNFLLGQVVKYLKLGHQNTTLKDFVEHGIIS